jgi:lambda family phage tail tape measure protein
MSDVTVSLSLDDSQYTNKLKTAEAAAKLFGTTSTTAFNGVKAGLTGITSSVDAVTSKFSGLAKAIASIGMTALIAGMLKSADALDDMAVSLGVNATRFQEMGLAAAQSGSDIDKLGNMMTKLEQNTQAALDGNDKMQASFEKIGISAQDIKTQAPDQLFYNISKALGSIQDPAERTAASMDLLGKGAKGFDPATFAKSIDELYGSFDKYAASQKAAADVTQQLETQVTLVKNEFLNLLKPLLDVVQAASGVDAQFSIAKVAAIALAAALAGIVGNTVLSGFKFLAEIIGGVSAAFTASSTATTIDSAAMDVNAAAVLRNSAARTAQSAQIAMAAAAAKAASYEEAAATALAAGELKNAEMAARNGAAAQAMYSAEKARYAAASGLAGASVAAESVAETENAVATGAAATAKTAAIGVWGAFAATVQATAAALVRSAMVMGTIAAIVGSAIAVVQMGYNYIKNGTFDNFIYDGVKSLLGLEDQTKATTVATDAGTAAGGAYAEANKKSAEEAKKLAGFQSDAAKAIDTQTASIKAATQAMVDQQQNTAKRMQIEMEGSIAIIGANQNEVNSKRRLLEEKLAMFDAETKAAQERSRILQEIAKIDKELSSGGGINAARKTALEGEKAALNDQLKTVNDIAASAGKLKDIELERKGVLEFQNSLLAAQQKAHGIVNDLEKESAQMTMSSNQKRMSDIDFMIKREQEAAVAQFESAAGRKATSEELLVINTKIADSYEGIKTKTQAVIDQSQSFSTGWTKAMNDYKQAAGDGAAVAQDLFTKGTKGMEDALVGFAKTGKLSWNDLLSSMLEALLRWGIQKAFAGIMDGMAGGGGLGGLISSVGKAFGIGGGGSSGSSGGGSSSGSGGGSSGGGSSGGSSGGGIWDTISGWFGGGSSSSSSSSSSGNNPYSGGGDYSGYTTGSSSNSGSSDTPPYQYYAKGGFIPAGKYGMVGEAGQELIQGPATVTPLDKLGTNVTYIINAVDPQSFKSLLAKDPSFVHAVVMQGAKSIPGGR